MIGDLVSGREKSKIIVVEDSVIQSGRQLLTALLTSLSQRVEKVHFISFDRDIDRVLDDVLPQDISQRIVLHNGFQDVLGWNHPENLNINTNIIQYLQDRPGRHANHSVAIVIDSISPLLLHRSAPYTCQTIVNLAAAKINEADVEQVVCLLHGDLHDNHTLALVEHIATSVIKVMPSDLSQFLMSANVIHKRLSGKVIKVTEHFNITEENNLSDVTEVKSALNTMSQEAPKVDPAANLTFNLSLTDSEKEARSQVKLPYTYDKDRQDITLSKSVGQGKIFYQPDEADDFDEEDPDDDLDI